MNDLAKFMTNAEREQSHPNVRPKDAATLILVDRSGATPKVLLGKRHHKHVFMPGKFVFPGGRAEPNDRLMPIAKPLDKNVEKQLMRQVVRPSAVKARALALAAIRETFEETGLLLGAKHRRCARRRRTVPGPNSPKPASIPICPFCISSRARSRRRGGRAVSTRASFRSMPPSIAHRIDNVVHPEAELVELVWVPIAEARKLDMPTITNVVLQELEARVAAGFGHDLPVPFYRMPHKAFTRELL